MRSNDGQAAVAGTDVEHARRRITHKIVQRAVDQHFGIDLPQNTRTYRIVGVVKDAAGEVVEVRCTYDPATRGGDATFFDRVFANAIDTAIKASISTPVCPFTLTVA